MKSLAVIAVLIFTNNVFAKPVEKSWAVQAKTLTWKLDSTHKCQSSSTGRCRIVFNGSLNSDGFISIKGESFKGQVEVDGKTVSYKAKTSVSQPALVISYNDSRQIPEFGAQNIPRSEAFRDKIVEAIKAQIGTVTILGHYGENEEGYLLFRSI